MNAPEPKIATAPADAVMVARAELSQFAPSLTNRRHTDDYIAELAASIGKVGVIQPITARPWPAARGTTPKGVLYEIVIGEGRWLATKAAGLADIPFFWRDLTDKQALELQLIENLKRKDLTPLEEATGYRRLIDDHAHNADSIAEEIGKSRTYVYNQIKLLDLCAEARTALEKQKIDASVALLIARIPSATLQRRALNEVSKGYDGEPLTYRNAKNHIQHHFTISLKQATFSLTDAELAPAAGSCEACPKRSGNDPALAADLPDADICTDTACFDDKRLARRQQLLAIAEQRQIAVHTGDDRFQVFNSGRYINLNDKIEGDGQNRSYREILGEDAPVNAIVELGHTDRTKALVEMAEPKALQKALEKAGWTPDMFKDAEAKAAHEKMQAERRAEEEQREKNRQAMNAETDRRKALQQTILGQLHAADDTLTARLLPEAAMAVVRMIADYYEFDDALFARYDFVTPDEYELADELDRLAQEMRGWPSGKLFALMIELTTDEEVRVPFDWEPDSQPPVLSALAAIFDSSPSQAAQAKKKSATKPAAPAKEAKKEKPAAGKSKAKADPAAATPPNEPAAPVKTVATKTLDPWPFPLKSGV